MTWIDQNIIPFNSSLSSSGFFYRTNNNSNSCSYGNRQWNSNYLFYITSSVPLWIWSTPLKGVAHFLILVLLIWLLLSPFYSSSNWICFLYFPSILLKFVGALLSPRDIYIYIQYTHFLLFFNYFKFFVNLFYRATQNNIIIFIVQYYYQTNILFKNTQKI